MAAPRDAVPVLRIPTLDMILAAHAAALGDDFEGYRNHAYRVANLCIAQVSASIENIEKVAVAAGFHDLGIWTDRTLDYLRPSVRLAREYLTQAERTEWIPEISETIFGHHKLSRYRGRDHSLVKPFRRADWMDVSMGTITFGLPRDLLQAAIAACRKAASTGGSSTWRCDVCEPILGVRCRW